MSIQEAVLLLVAVISGLVALLKGLEYLLDKTRHAVEKLVKPLTDELHTLQKSVCTNYLVRFLSDIEHGEKLDDVEWQRFWDNYETYTKLGGNSYIKDKVAKLQSQHKL